MNAHFVTLPGDGIGPEVIAQAIRVLEAVADRFDHTFSFEEELIGGAAIDAHGAALGLETVEAALASDAVLLGAVGGPRWDDPNSRVRPEQGLLGIREAMRLFANLRPITVFPQLADASPLRPEILRGVDILFFRELTGGIYFGESGVGEGSAYQVMSYTEGEVARIVRMAADSARTRRGKLTMVDKANVLEPSRLWRRVTTELIAAEYEDLDFEVVLVDAMAMYLLSRPADYDVVVTANLFGDILTDEASMITGSLGMLPSASVGLDGPGLYEPVHGSAPDIAGAGVANPLATILAAAMALRHSLNLEQEAAAVEAAVASVIASGLRTPDIAAGGESVGTTAMADAVLAALSASTE
ncbi:MAG: 3-isopropylmalate dehydrogenase [Acidimicrobiia bacterium]|nr:MAG: 3-isopropylmalate dehydrogenase [Acidimicrobiia bacterium]